MRVLTAIFAGTLLSVSACNSERTDQMPAENDLGSNVNIPSEVAPTASQAFVDAAAASDKFEIESSKLAENAGASEKIKSFAKQMISGHTASTAKLKLTLTEVNPPTVPNDALDAEQQATIDSLRGKSGADFDAAYAAAQAQAHQKTLDVLKAYAASGDNPTLVAFAKDMIPVVTAHLNMANGLAR